ncbi:DUF1604 domain protein [Hortaea werneckii]|nr:DUF1604 domain protein [Hortaea werneckii]
MYPKRSRAAFESDHNGPPNHAPFAVFGTPLPVYDAESRDDGSYVPVWKQEVTDERGRKRLHGAFTGGFSAGYFNTVGSKEGWTPATFVSSRANRAKKEDELQKQQRPEDFMDDEDLAEQAEQQRLETSGTFAGLGSGAENGAKQGGMFADLFRSTGETMGVKLLQRMGWRQGQGVGPKVKRRAKGDDKGEVHSFAPENSRMISFSRKTDRKGLGFSGEERLQQESNSAVDDEQGEERDARILQPNRSKFTNKPKMKKKTGIGMGVLNDTGSDDEDPYAIGPQISYNRIIGGDRKKKKGGLVASNAKLDTPKPVFTSKRVNDSTKMSKGFRKCHDGRLPLDGFVLSLEPLSLSEANKYPPPEVPAGWTNSKSSSNTSQANIAYQSTADAAKASTLDPKARAAVLGEQQLPGKSVFDFISPAMRDRVASATGKTNLPRGLGESAPAGFEASEAEKRRTLWDLVPELDKRTAAAALHRGTTGWMPYQEDDEKRSRYRYFLELKCGLKTNLPDRPKDLSLDDWSKEMREFAQAAEVFKPVSGLMAARFTSSSTTPQLASDAPDTASAPPQKEEDPAEKAAKMGMYGPMTRSRQAFFPTRLLCKRFNVRPPANAGGDPGAAPDSGEYGDDAKGRLEVVSQASLNRMMQEASWNRGGSGFVSCGTEGAQQGGVQVEKPQAPAEVDVEKNEALEGQKAGDAVFKAIFGSDDEDDD